MEGEKATQPAQPTHFVHHGRKCRINPVLLFTLIGIVIIAAVLILIFVLRGQQTTPELEKINLTYSIAFENGTLIDSGTASFSSGTVASTLGFKTNKLDAELALMAEGEEKNITLEAQDAYGAYDESLVFSYNRTVMEAPREQKLNKTIVMTIEMFKTNFNEQPVVNKSYQNGLLKLKVISFNESDVELAYEMKVGESYPSGLFDYDFEIVEINDKITLRLQGNDSIHQIPSSIGQGSLEVNFTDSSIKITLTPLIGSWIALEGVPKAKVTGMNSTHLFLDANKELAGKKIIVSVKINAKYKEKSTATGAVVVPNAPTMEVFIMSYCPYGLQALKGLLPVMEKFSGKANIALRFVSYTMHGDKEEEENYRMICIREEQSSKLIAYLKCFVEKGDATACLKQAEIDETKLNSCMTSRVQKYFEKDKMLNEQYGVRGSPTYIIDGKEVNVYPRDPQTVANALCDAFTSSKPSVCSEAFSTANPSPGFGTSSSSPRGGSGGSCG